MGGNRGRPAKLTHTIREDLIAGVKQGLTLKAACRCARVSYSALASWMIKGRKAMDEDKPNEYSQLTTEIQSIIEEIRNQNVTKERASIKPRDMRYWHEPFKSEARVKQRQAYLEAKARNFVLCTCQKDDKMNLSS